jgi:hypothetical protein
MRRTKPGFNNPHGNPDKVKTKMKARIACWHRHADVVRSILASVIVAAGVVLSGAAAIADSPGLPNPNVVYLAASPSEARIETHETRVESQEMVQFPNASEITNQVEAFSPSPPTRSSFMATWDKITVASGYLLDVSTSSLFDSYVDGYHDLDVGNVTGRTVTGLNQGTTYYYRVRPYTATVPAGYSEVMKATTVPTTGLNIHATFDTSITSKPNAPAIEAMINRAIAAYESLFNDPITIQIRFRYATTNPNGTPMPSNSLARSLFIYYTVPWNVGVAALRADAKTINDNLAVASLPGTPLAPTIEPSSANGRALGADTPPAMFANGTVGNGGPYDGIVTLNSAVPFKFTRPASANYFDAQRSTEHEMGEVMGLGSKLGHTGIDLRPQDVFSWSSFGHRNITGSGTRYFSINSGSTHIINFNQNPNGDFGDWWSSACPQAHPYVQNAFGCAGQFSDVTATTPEGINLDVIGYDLRSVTGPPIVTTNPATNVARFSSTLRGTVNPSSLSTTVRFQYGRTTSYGHITANQTKTGNNTQPVITNISGLSADTTYHFRIVATNTAVTRYGSDRTFTTLP